MSVVWKALVMGLPLSAASMNPASASDGVYEKVDAANLETQAVSTKPDLNPFNRDINLTAPLQFNSRILGEIEILLTKDDDMYVDSASFQRLIAPLLTLEAQDELRVGLQAYASFTPAQLELMGVRLDYDPQQLAVMVLRIDPTKRSLQNLFEEGRRDEVGERPSFFSAYLNSNLVLMKRSDEDSLSKPSGFLSGAVRIGNLVLEADVQGREDFNDDGYVVDRRYARLVYDQPERFRRFYLGDLEPETRGRQGFTQMGGIGVVRQRQRFDSFRSNALVGNRQLLLQENSTVRIMRNGVLQRELQLDAGQYDVSNLPLEMGSNNIELEVVGTSGIRNTVQYSAYLDTIDLEPGDYEYGAFFGVNSQMAFGSPDYSDGDLVFTGYYRKAFVNAPALGLGLQATKEVQTISGQTQVILPAGARLRFDGAASRSDYGQGYALSTALDYLIGLGLQNDSLTISADYTSQNFAVLGGANFGNPTSWQVSAGYSRQFNERWSSSVTGGYRVSRIDERANGYTVNLLTNYRLNSRWSIQSGLEYIESGLSSSSYKGGFGASIALIWRPKSDSRAEARYNSARNSGSVRYSQNTDNRVGGFGYSVNSTYDDGPAAISGQVDYIGNRFAAAITHGSYGQTIGDITDRQITTVRIGSAIATTGRAWGIGRNIYDSFAIVVPHETLDSDVIVGDTLASAQYVSKSGRFGGAVANNLSSYQNQSIRHDAVNPPLGYDTGTGVSRVYPSYRSGYEIVVGRANFVSAVGRLVDLSQKPIALTSGRIRPADEPDAKLELFFTNSAGRFAVQNLEPGKRYLVELPSIERAFELVVPEDSEGLLDLKQVMLSVETEND